MTVHMCRFTHRHCSTCNILILALCQQQQSSTAQGLESILLQWMHAHTLTLIRHFILHPCHYQRLFPHILCSYIASAIVRDSHREYII